jgi:hypothetical protein
VARREKKQDAGSGAKRDVDDVALVWGASADGDTVGVLRRRGEQVTSALMRKAREGQPVQGELVRLRARDEPLLYDVDVLYDPGAAEAAPDAVPERAQDERALAASEGARRSDGPPRVATEAYRKGWDRLFKRPRGESLN